MFVWKEVCGVGSVQRRRSGLASRPNYHRDPLGWRGFVWKEVCGVGSVRGGQVLSDEYAKYSVAAQGSHPGQTITAILWVAWVVRLERSVRGGSVRGGQVLSDEYVKYSVALRARTRPNYHRDPLGWRGCALGSVGWEVRGGQVLSDQYVKYSVAAQGSHPGQTITAILWWLGCVVYGRRSTAAPRRLPWGCVVFQGSRRIFGRDAVLEKLL